ASPHESKSTPGAPGNRGAARGAVPRSDAAARGADRQLGTDDRRHVVAIVRARGRGPAGPRHRLGARGVRAPGRAVLGPRGVARCWIDPARPGRDRGRDWSRISCRLRELDAHGAAGWLVSGLSRQRGAGGDRDGGCGPGRPVCAVCPRRLHRGVASVDPVTTAGNGKRATGASGNGTRETGNGTTVTCPVTRVPCPEGAQTEASRSAQTRPATAAGFAHPPDRVVDRGAWGGGRRRRRAD